MRLVPDYATYVVDEYGQVFHGDRLLQQTTRKGMRFVRLSDAHGKRREMSVARLVARAYLGEPPYEGALVRHINGDLQDNRAANLEWRICRVHTRGRRQKLTPEQTAEIERDRDTPPKTLAERYGVSASHVRTLQRLANWRGQN